MDTRPNFLRTTLIGGVLYLIPVVVLLAILGKAMQIAERISTPLLRGIEAASLGHILRPQVVAFLMLLLFCFVMGLFARTAFARRIGAFLDTRLLANLPGYAFFKSVADSLAGVEPAGAHSLVMASVEDAWQIAMVVDTLKDGLLAVYIPDVPQGRSGSLLFMTPDRVRPLSISMKSAMVILRRMGAGSKELLQG
jgi:uncharacterized membrane protein